MSATTNCPDCNHEILSRLGTICPNCGYTIGYFNGNEKRKKYGKFFALTVFTPFISFSSVVFTSINIYTIFFGIVLFLFLAAKSCPILFKDIFLTGFEKAFFWLIWLLANGIISLISYNLLTKLIHS